MVELAAFRDCTATPNAYAPAPSNNIDSENREGDCGWPGMMTIKVHELDGTHDHLLPMAGDACQVLEIKCHSRLAAKRFQKSKKSAKPDGSDDNGDTVTTVDIRSRYLIFLASNGVIVTVFPPISECIYMLNAVQNHHCYGSERTLRWNILRTFTLTSLYRCG